MRGQQVVHFKDWGISMVSQRGGRKYATVWQPAKLVIRRRTPAPIDMRPPKAQKNLRKKK
ncbi:MAG: hypothetical protein A3C50_01800 [Candidatus Staskawiczbacteria bacterium RIFCSPHIGHO2_02_FULL_43_16]|uniref:Uncharacterized protein n=1 Tax=Candidatus Staskawiczbacteria bacterium RIFCSPHIGHO2_01_FULL_41_41 TaxID=1802203 RepID=A0A1G2HUK8_9BACT|nr:MAG: hypothetical protein A2822_04220 [Candidatus Staskawiczbacteria bacterium RIFCSPHIGHO2_01_FULL_41_41]OGZ69113.1 MAG: hypothetical protein A3C50_01800 [Candidatus Staskawiczbacteria bacterium RIFCSPHIGHO2_02_FULL_43_16]OGZ74460.1 MAG: hypothetical protein A3A12_01690 [Candidatus Staskawiczbacteria bacterium RIFCSPLOWO2_01_FULL_43_17b]